MSLQVLQAGHSLPTESAEELFPLLAVSFVSNYMTTVRIRRRGNAVAGVRAAGILPQRIVGNERGVLELWFEYQAVRPSADL